MSETINGVKVRFGCKWIFKGFAAMTLLGRVYVRKDRNQIDTDSYSFRVMLNHERIHLMQGKELGWTKFTLLYLWYWFIVFIRTFNNDTAYYTIPFEREAYSNQNDFSYSSTKWRDYKLSVESRINSFRG